MALIRSSIKSRAKFDINDLVPMNHVKAGFIPAFFVAGKQDTFIDPHHAKDLFEKYAGDKNIVVVDGDHNSPRPSFLLDSIAIFFYNTLLCDLLPKDKSTDNDKPMVPAVNLSESYLLHNVKLENNIQAKIGNEEEVAGMLQDFGEEDLRLALEESLKINGDMVKADPDAKDKDKKDENVLAKEEVKEDLK